MEIPDADILLHADCNEQEVNCEISRYIPRGSDPNAAPTHFIGSLQVEGGGVSLTLVLELLPNEEAAPETQPLIQSKLELPLSQSGTLLTEGEVHHCEGYVKAMNNLNNIFSQPYLSLSLHPLLVLL